MSDAMLHGILNMPIDAWADDEISKTQRHNAYAQASMRIKSDERPSFEFWAILEDGKLEDDMYGIGIINRLHYSELDKIHKELKEHVLGMIERFPANCVIDFIAKNVVYEDGQMSFPETGQWDFPPHYTMDITTVEVKTNDIRETNDNETGACES